MLQSVIFRFVVTVFLIAFLFPPVHAEPKTSASLSQIAADYWQRQLDQNIYYRMKFGLPITELPDPTYGGNEKEAKFCKSIIERLNQVDQKEITHEEIITLEALKWECSQVNELLPYFWYLSPITPYNSSLPIVHRAFSTYELNSQKDGESYLQLLKTVPAYVKKLQETVQEQAQRGIRIPKEELAIVTPFLSSYARKAKESPFFVAEERRKKLSPEFEKQLITIIDDDIHPAFQSLIDSLNGTYRELAPDKVGVQQYLGGKEAYSALVRHHTTMNVTPEEVHETGQKAVQALQKRMAEIRTQLNFKGTQEEFHQQLKKDPRFIPKTADEIGKKLLYYDRRIQAKLPEYFSLKPKARYTVKRLDPDLEGSMTFGYYQVPTTADPTGTYYYNGSNLPERPTFNSASLVYHELVPGHHFQINLQSENASLPAFRREGGHTAFVEGWAEYASSLAEEMGMYEDPYELYGRLAAEMFLTVRLVVDTGMNYYGWPREKAVAFMKENLLESDTQIHTESLRYSTDIPGQALGYKMGMFKIRDLREKAKRELGDRFDIRKFHAAVLGSGSMPMTVLEQHIQWFIANAGSTARRSE